MSKEVIDIIKKEISSRWNKSYTIKEVIKHCQYLLRDTGLNDRTELKKELEQLIVDLNEEISILETEVKPYIEQLNLAKSQCKHQMEWDGHDSHYDYYKCKICGEEDRR